MKRGTARMRIGVCGLAFSAMAMIDTLVCAQAPTTAPQTPSARPRVAVASDVDGEKPSVIVVRPPSWQSALDAWIQYRSDAYTIVQVDSQPTSLKQQQMIRDAALRTPTPATAVLLCGDVAREIPLAEAPPQGNTTSTKDRSRKGIEVLTPGMVLDTTVRLGPLTTPSLCTDATFGDLDGDGCPELAVGRLPAKSPSELERMLSRSMLYESASAGPWNDTVHVTAGVGGFGVVADAAIETVTRRFLTEGIPDHFRLQMTYASCTSAYCPNPLKLRESYIDRINQGGLFWIYIGHGAVTHLDYMQAGNAWLPIGEPEDAQRFRIRARPPIAVLLACFTGAYDANVDCFAERLLAEESGPVAVIAGSRVTMPYGLSQLASEMINGCFRDRVPTLGAVVLQAKRKIWEDDAHADQQPPAQKNGDGNQRVDIRQRYRKIITEMAMALNPGEHDLLAERREHVRLMNLLGDPLLKLPYPNPMELHVPSQIEPASKVTIGGEATHDGTLVVELALVRDRLPEGIIPVSSYDGSPSQLERMQDTYDTANDLVVARIEKRIAAGPFEATLDVPEDLKGRCVVSACVYSERQWSVGSQRVSVRKAK